MGWKVETLSAAAARSGPRGRPVCVVLLAATLLPPAVRAGEHPRLLITRADLPRLRHACGVGPPVTGGGFGRFGAGSADFNALRARFARPLGGNALPGELAAAAFLHLVTPDDPTERARLEFVRAALEHPYRSALDPLELVLALDWCWDALEPDVRREFLLAARQRAKPLTAADSPLEQRVFREKLAALALALVADDELLDSAWSDLRHKLLAAGRSYFKNTFPTFIAWRGLAPTSPAAAACEENDTALALELAGLLRETDVWAPRRQSVGRWMEHYVLAAAPHPALQHQFLRDDGPGAPLSPAAQWDGLQPLTAHLIAARTHDPAAAYVADRVADAMRDPSAQMRAAPWRWVPLVFALRGVPRCDPAALPLARNFAGAAVFRGGTGPYTTVVWIEAAQPHLRRRQHFDAGHFLIRSGGHLAGGAGDEIAFEAIPAKGGCQRLGDRPQSFDFEQYCVSTIAHNCMIFYDAARVPRWHGRRFAPVGGQRLIEDTCTDFDTTPETNPRRTGRWLAYGQQPPVAYLALDLTSAYEPRAVTRYIREFVFLWQRVLFVIDRVQPANSRVRPTWIVNLPNRPTLAGRDLPADTRSAGSDNQAGVWRADDAEWLRWQETDGVLWLRSLLPRAARVTIVGGPARRLRVAQGPFAGRPYVGGDPDGFERLVIPALRPRPLNAWYRLGRPTRLGPQFGKVPHWGRIEIEPARRGGSSLFVTILVTDRAGAERAPQAGLRVLPQAVEVSLTLDERTALLRLPTGLAPGGLITLAGPPPVRWQFPTDVNRDGPLPTRQP